MMGQSGGRSANHRTARGAVRRATQRERDYVDPPWEDQPPLPLYPPPVERMLAALAWLTLVTTLVLLLLLAVG